MTDPMELAGRLENLRIVLKSGDYDGADLMRAWCAMSDAAACIREMVEQKPFAHFQWNDGWKVWEQVVDDAAGEDGVVAAYRLPLPPAPGAEDE